MRVKRRSALLVSLLGIVLTTIFAGSAHAGGSLGVGVRIEQELYKPRAPVSKAFKPCFKTDPATGTFIMGLCSETETPTRLPASSPSPNPKQK